MNVLRRYSDKTKVGCPTCDGIDPKSCMRCSGFAVLSDWYLTDRGWAHKVDLTREEIGMVRPDGSAISRDG